MSPHEMFETLRARLPRRLSSRSLAPMEALAGATMFVWGLSGLGLLGTGQLNRTLADNGLAGQWGGILCVLGTVIAVLAAWDYLFGRHWPEQRVMRSAALRALFGSLAVFTWVWVANSLIRPDLINGVGALKGQIPIFLFAHGWSAALNILVKALADEAVPTKAEFHLER